MRAVRRIAAGLIACALALVPAVGFAEMRVTQHETGASAHDMSVSAQENACTCCEAAPAGAADACIMKCCSAVAILTEVQPPPAGRTVVADMAAVALSPFAQPPDLPPPRS